MSARPDATPPVRPAVRLAAVVVTLLGLAIAAELAARGVYAFEDRIKAALRLPEQARDLNVFEMQDPLHPKNWVLRPNVSLTFREVVASKAQSARELGVKRLQEAGERLGIRPEDVVFHVNSSGYKGPAELDAVRSRPRVLTIGDSCTFGSELDAYAYPRALERALAGRGRPVEVVNAGVGGYAPWNVLLRMDELAALKPGWTTLYIGWNALFAERNLHGPTHWSYAARVLESVLLRLSGGVDGRALAREAYTKAKRVDAAELDAGWLRRYEPSFFGEVVDIVDAMQAAGSRVVLVTIPGLYTTREPPTERALSFGHLPETTDNPYVLAAMSERYNDALRALAKERGLPLVDLERWADGALVPRDAWFTDSVHLTEEGQVRIGDAIADALLPLMAGDGARAPSTTR